MSLKPKRPSKESNTEPQNWECCICQNNFIASNELTYHYLNHSILELALALTNVLAIKNGCQPLTTFPRKPDSKTGPSIKVDKPELESQSEICDFDLSDGEGHVTDHDEASIQSERAASCRKSRLKTKNLKIEIFSCDICGKVLSSKGNLKKHKVVHSNVKPWQCKECPMTFNQARDLNSHKMQNHSEERPHVCKICGKGFVHKFYLAEHMDYHTGNRKWQCSQCGKRFQSTSTLAKHVQRHKTERNFSCDQCPKSFTVKVDLRSHIRLIHEKAGLTGIPIFPARSLKRASKQGKNSSKNSENNFGPNFLESSLQQKAMSSPWQNSQQNILTDQQNDIALDYVLN